MDESVRFRTEERINIQDMDETQLATDIYEFQKRAAH